jgi:hypothetical protein
MISARLSHGQRHDLAMALRLMYLVAVPPPSARRIASRFLYGACLLGGLSIAHAQLLGSGSIGTEEFPGLQINSEARPAGMAGAYAALAEGTSSIGINPAGLAHLTGSSYSGTVRYAPDAADGGDVAYARPLSDGSELAISAAYLNYGSIQSLDENGQPLGSLNPFDFYPAVTYARAQGDHVQWGVSLKGAQEYQGNFAGSQNAFGVGADAGVQYHPARNLGVGASVVNLGFKLRGHSSDEATGSDLLPADFRVGGVIRPQGLEDMSIELDAEAPLYEPMALSLGYEYRVLPEWDLRAGTRWDSNDIRNLLGWLGATQNVETGGSALKASVGTTLQVGRADVDYALQWWNDLGFVSQLTLTWRMN